MNVASRTHPRLVVASLVVSALAALAQAARGAEPSPWAAAQARGVIYADCARNASRLLQPKCKRTYWMTWWMRATA